jgi:hypothetical protein
MFGVVAFLKEAGEWRQGDLYEGICHVLLCKSLPPWLCSVVASDWVFLYTFFMDFASKSSLKKWKTAISVSITVAVATTNLYLLPGDSTS